MPPATTLLLAFRAPPLRPLLAPVTPFGFLSPLLLCRCLNIFHRDPNLVFHCLLPLPPHTESPPSFKPCLSRTHIKNRPGGHPLRHCFLLPCQIFPYFLCTLSLQNFLCRNLPPRPVPSSRCVFTCDLYLKTHMRSLYHLTHCLCEHTCL